MCVYKKSRLLIESRGANDRWVVMDAIGRQGRDSEAGAGAGSYHFFFFFFCPENKLKGAQKRQSDKRAKVHKHTAIEASKIAKIYNMPWIILLVSPASTVAKNNGHLPVCNSGERTDWDFLTCYPKHTNCDSFFACERRKWYRFLGCLTVRKKKIDCII